MTKEDRAKFAEMYEKLEKFIGEKADPGNGNWKTARAVFEQKTVDNLDAINLQLKSLNERCDPIVQLCQDVKELKEFRKRTHRILWLIITPLVTSIFASLGYVIASKLW